MYSKLDTVKVGAGLHFFMISELCALWSICNLFVECVSKGIDKPGIDNQEKAQSEKDSHSKNRGGKN